MTDLSEHVLDTCIHDMVDRWNAVWLCPGRGTTDDIFIACQIQEKYVARKKPLYLACVNLEKAFDHIPGM